MVLLVLLVLCMTRIFGNDLNKQLVNKKIPKRTMALWYLEFNMKSSFLPISMFLAEDLFELKLACLQYPFAILPFGSMKYFP